MAIYYVHISWCSEILLCHKVNTHKYKGDCMKWDICMVFGQELGFVSYRGFLVLVFINTW